MKIRLWTNIVYEGSDDENETKIETENKDDDRDVPKIEELPTYEATTVRLHNRRSRPRS